MKYVIIGAGVAGVEAAKVITAQEESAEIVMISAGHTESFPLYAA